MNPMKGASAPFIIASDMQNVQMPRAYRSILTLG